MLFMKSLRWAFCQCWFTDNVFIPKLNLHIRYMPRDEFEETYSQAFKDQGLTKADFDHAFEHATAEHHKRRLYEQTVLENKVHNLTTFSPEYPGGFVLQKEDFTPEFLRLVQLSRSKTVSTDALLAVLEEVEGVHEVYRFPLINSNCLERLNRLLDLFDEQGCHSPNPNTMNQAGMLMSLIPGQNAGNGSALRDTGGADIDLMESLLTHGLGSILSRLYPDSGARIDSYRLFTVEYANKNHSDERGSVDHQLTPHYDNSELTANICLRLTNQLENKMEGELYFCHPSPHDNSIPDPSSKLPYAKLIDHRPGWILLHRGSHWHGVRPFCSSDTLFTRRSLIGWMRSSHFRSNRCPRCFNKPRLSPMQVWHDHKLIECNRLNENALRDGDFVRVGFADGFLIT